LSNSALTAIGICAQKFTRGLALAGLVAALLTIPGCGGDDEDGATTPAATARAETATTESAPRTETGEEAEKPTETATETESPEAPEEMPGGAGDEEPARTLALFSAEGGRITPRVVRVPAFIAVEVELRSADGESYSLRFGDDTITAGGELSSVSTTLDGLRPGEAIVGTPRDGGNRVRIEATAEPGP